MSDLIELAARVEALAGPCRKMDALISATARTGYGLEYQWALKYPAWIGGDDGRVHLEKNGPSFAPPAYTASLDAAMTLVPEGWSVGLGDLRGYDPVIWRAHLRDHNEPYNPSTCEWIEGHAATGALALTAAALRARAAS